MANKSVELALECKRESENCLYTSTAFFMWLRFLRWVRIFFVSAPVILGSFASWKLLTEINFQEIKYVTAVCSFIAGLLPALYSALKLDDYLEQCKTSSAEFKNLQDRFRKAALVSSRKDFTEFEDEYLSLMERLEQARSPSLTPPDWFFRRAQKKVKKGDYEFDIDIKEINAKSELTD